MLLLLGAFIAGILTVAAPCVLPLLPIIIGGSISGKERDLKKPLYITISLAVSLFVFTLLLKASTLLISVPPESYRYISGAIIIILGIFTLFPGIYARILGSFGVESKALRLLSKGSTNKSSVIGAIITGAALGPVFSSCSPVYGYIIATVLPVNFTVAMVYITAYILGLSFVLLLIGYYGQRFVGKIKWLSDPKGTFSRIIAIVFIVVGLLVFTGYDKKFQTYVSEHTPLNFDAISENFIPDSDRKARQGEILNVEPYAAPDFKDTEAWINSDPLTMAGLKGKVVLVDFWTYSCINCIRNNPYIEAWYEKYKDDGLVVIGMHAPEFSFERNPDNVRKATQDQKISYPVALDNNFSTWNAFQNQYWPTAYLIDAEGMVRRVHSGEGEYRESEEAIRMLLKENGAKLDDELTTTGNETPPVTAGQTAETYTGSKRVSNFASNEAIGSNPKAFSFPTTLSNNQWALSGSWKVSSDSILARDNAKLRFKISSKETYFVASSATNAAVKVLLGGKPISETDSAGQDVVDSQVMIGEAKLYRIVRHTSFTEGYEIELEVPAGVEISVFTFGS